MIHYLTCNGYAVLHVGRFDDDAPAECLRLETERNDGFAVVASRDGLLVADAEGWWEREPHTPDAATQTGMYDP